MIVSFHKLIWITLMHFFHNSMNFCQPLQNSFNFCQQLWLIWQLLPTYGNIFSFWQLLWNDMDCKTEAWWMIAEEWWEMTNNWNGWYLMIDNLWLMTEERWQMADDIYTVYFNTKSHMQFKSCDLVTNTATNIST